jgi:hypothetical protein
MKRNDQTEREGVVQASAALARRDEAPLAGEAALAEALFGAEGGATTDHAPRIRWRREWGLWTSLALAALLAVWRITRIPATLALATGSVLGIAVAYVWMRRAFGAGVAVTGTLLLAAGEGMVMRTSGWLPLVPALLALWALLLFSVLDARTTSGAGWSVLASSVPLALATWLLPETGGLAVLAPFALALRPSRRASRAPVSRLAREWGFALAAIALPVVAMTLTAVRGHGATSGLGVPGWLTVALVLVAAAGWLSLVLRLLAPARALWRWYALASGPDIRQRAVWRGLLAEPGWGWLVLLWMACTGPIAVMLDARYATSPLMLLPATAALPGMMVEELRARRAGVWATRLRLALVGALAVAMTVASLQ